MFLALRLAVALPFRKIPCIFLFRQVWRSLIQFLLALALAGCTTIGFDHPTLLRDTDFGPVQTVRLCAYLDDGVSPENVMDLLHSWDPEGENYNLFIKVVSFEHHQRVGFFHTDIMADVQAIPLKPSCDRLLFFAARNVSDSIYGLTPLPQVLGEVDDATLTHGYVIAQIASLNQLLTPPGSVTRHELYHLVGCAKHFDMPDCYGRILMLKKKAAELRADKPNENLNQPFFPTFANLSYSMITTRAEVNEILGSGR